MWPFEKQDPSVSDPAALRRAAAAGYSSSEWSNFTPELRASCLSDPAFGTKAIVSPEQKISKPPSLLADTLKRSWGTVKTIAKKMKFPLIGIGGLLLVGGSIYLGMGRRR